MTVFRGMLGVMFVCLFPAVAAGQSLLPIVLEARVGYATPVGDFGNERGTGAGPGPSLAIGARLEATPAVAIFGAYHHTRFGCSDCSTSELDETILMEGVEAGVAIVLGAKAGMFPWLRGGALIHTLGFTAGDARITSGRAIGFTAAAGLTIPLMSRLEASPGIRYLTAPAEFSFSIAPDLTVDVAGFAVDIAIGFRL